MRAYKLTLVLKSGTDFSTHSRQHFGPTRLQLLHRRHLNCLQGLETTSHIATSQLALNLRIDAGEITQCTQMRDGEWDDLYVTSIALSLYTSNLLLIHSPVGLSRIRLND